MIEEQKVDIPCPVCFKTGEVNMIAHVSEIPYFGEHTQVTVMCHSCGWRQTDFIPAEGKKAGGWSLTIENEQNLKSRVVRSSSCTVQIEELDLQVSPGTSSTGYVSNVEGVLNRFLKIIDMVLLDLQNDSENQSEDISKLESMRDRIMNLGKDDCESLTLVLLDPHGHSMIIDKAAIERELTEKELSELPVGPEPAVFQKDD
ncbi:MAG: ZPR1 zinc finger domain-containing protein [Euryarchaeota archaeon TMED248]|nr:MAG: ZPR1 zinc finger domain-containing protein [Euryarchaeota archaeon TMED248]